MNICEQARKRWPLGAITIIHQVGDLTPDEQIVFVGVSSKHRKAAFAACEFIMDFLKVEAPFWKKEITESGEFWVKAKGSDQDKAFDWLDKIRGSYNKFVAGSNLRVFGRALKIKKLIEILIINLVIQQPTANEYWLLNE